MFFEQTSLSSVRLRLVMLSCFLHFGIRLSIHHSWGTLNVVSGHNLTNRHVLTEDDSILLLLFDITAIVLILFLYVIKHPLPFIRFFVNRFEHLGLHIMMIGVILVGETLVLIRCASSRNRKHVGPVFPTFPCELRIGEHFISIILMRLLESSRDQ